MLRVAFIIQARMSSTRLPGKVLMDICGKSMLHHVLERVTLAGQNTCAPIPTGATAAKLEWEVVVATSDRSEDDAIAREAMSADARVMRGSLDDVLGRYVMVARMLNYPDVIVRVTADCPLLESAISALVVCNLLNSRRADLASNCVKRTFPRGLDTEAMWLDTLLRLDRLVSHPTLREHVTLAAYLDERERFELSSVEQYALPRLAEVQWSVDTLADLERVRGIYRRFHGEPPGYVEILTTLARES